MTTTTREYWECACGHQVRTIRDVCWSCGRSRPLPKASRVGLGILVFAAILIGVTVFMVGSCGARLLVPGTFHADDRVSRG